MQKIDIKGLVLHRCFSGLAYVFFNRLRSAWFCFFVTIISLLAEIEFGVDTLFSCSGAIFTLAGLFLNIKHTLHFHLKLPKQTIFYMLAGAGILADEMTEQNEKWTNDILADEMVGVSFMIIGTLIWAYGGFFIRFIELVITSLA